MTGPRLPGPKGTRKTRLPPLVQDITDDEAEGEAMRALYELGATHQSAAATTRQVVDSTRLWGSTARAALNRLHESGQLRCTGKDGPRTIRKWWVRTVESS